jgi:hypothetical protein
MAPITFLIVEAPALRVRYENKWRLVEDGGFNSNGPPVTKVQAGRGRGSETLRCVIDSEY